MSNWIELDLANGRFVLEQGFSLFYRGNDGSTIPFHELEFDHDEVMKVWPAHQPGTNNVKLAMMEIHAALNDGRLVARVRSNG